ncbi:transposase [Trichodesmium erythraeum]|nr:hypothetical protein [Trichodesmium erythraeum GBRTRLIN201]
MLFQTPYFPEFNPIERLWKDVKKIWKNRSFNS